MPKHFSHKGKQQPYKKKKQKLPTTQTSFPHTTPGYILDEHVAESAHTKQKGQQSKETCKVYKKGSLESELWAKEQRQRHKRFLQRQNDVSRTPHQRIRDMMRQSKKGNGKKYNKKRVIKQRAENADDTSTTSNTKTKRGAKGMKKQTLEGAQFRWMNEMLYNSTGHAAMNSVQGCAQEFAEYHSAYNDIVQHQWPESPLQKIIKSIQKKLNNMTRHANHILPEYSIADFGCGDAKIAQYFSGKNLEENKLIRNLPIKVHSFDLVALNEHVTPCDISNVPLEAHSVDLAVFCLSLMGTNFHEYMAEAHRVLKPRGLLKIAEVRSRFYSITKFERFLNRCGFEVPYKLLDNTHFALFHCVKSDTKMCQSFPKGFNAQKVLKPCVYKRR